MKKRLFSIFTIVLLCYSCTETTNNRDSAEEGTSLHQSTASQSTATSKEALIERGKYLVTIGSCNDCHSPKVMKEGAAEPVPDESRLLSGHPSNEKLPPVGKNAGKDGWVMFSMGSTAIVGPWGTSFTANLTPDPTGIGNWTLDHFKKALREGKSKGLDNNRMLLPPMPWPNYRNMKDEDIEAIFTYLKSIPPVKNVVPAPIPPVS